MVSLAADQLPAAVIQCRLLVAAPEKNAPI